MRLKKVMSVEVLYPGGCHVLVSPTWLFAYTQSDGRAIHEKMRALAGRYFFAETFREPLRAFCVVGS